MPNHDCYCSMNIYPILTILLLPLMAATLLAQDEATGVVFHDTNQNGIFDTGETGIADVLVTNGREVVKTRKDGSYQLPVTDDTILFVIQPKGWKVPLNEFNLPRFHYIHKPKGSRPDLKYPGVAPTGPLPDSVNFPLTPGIQGNTFSFFAFGDPQPYSQRDVDYFRQDIVEQARTELEPVAGVTLGDIVGDDLNLFDAINEVIVQMNRPWWHVYGNHDMNMDARTQEEADETFERVYGPATYAFQIGDVVFIGLDNVLFPNPISDKFYLGGFTEKQLAFIENLLAHIPEDKLIVTMMHIPLYDEGWGDSFWDPHREAFFQLFKNHKHTLSLSAHTHTQNHHFFDHEEGHWPHINAPHHHYNVGTTSGSWWRGPLDERGIPTTPMRDGTPNGYAILHFKGNQYTYDYRVAHGPRDEVMSIYAPTAVPYNTEWSYALLSINFYNGSADAKVEFRVNGGNWWQARHKETVDPQYAYNRFARDQLSNPPPQKSLPYPELSSHIWTGRLPTDLEPGIQLIEVRVTDRFGRVFEDATTYRILPKP